MSSSTSRKARDEHLAAVRAAQARQQRRRTLLISIAVLAVLVVIAVAVMIAISQEQKTKNDAAAQQTAKDQAFISKVTSVPPTAFEQVGVGNAQGVPTPIPNPSPMTENGKPRVLYVGAEFCPYCAMERWSLVAALSRFGTFHGLSGAVSSSDEGALSNIQTLTFKGATYDSKYVAFKAYETTDREHQPLESLSSSDEALFSKLNPQGGIPWIDWGGVATSGVGYDGSLLAGKTNSQIAAALSDPTSDIAKGVLGAANVASAQICALTQNQPADVCSAAGVQAAAAKLHK